MVGVYSIRHNKAYGYNFWNYPSNYTEFYLICNFNHTCQITNNLSEVEHNFKFNLDTFDLDQLNIIK